MQYMPPLNPSAKEAFVPKDGIPRDSVDEYAQIFFAHFLTKDRMNHRWLIKQDTGANEDILEDIFVAP